MYRRRQFRQPQFACRRPRGGRPCSSRFGVAILLALLFAGSSAASGETLRAALRRAISANPGVNAQRANLAAVEEKIPQARAGFLPRLDATAEFGRRSDSISTPNSYYDPALSTGTGYALGATNSTYATWPRGAGLELSQSLFDGGKTANSVKQASSLVAGATEGVRGAEQDILLATTAAYLNVVRARRTVEIHRGNVAFLVGQLGVVQERHGFGDVTVVDLAQARGRLSEAKFRLTAAEAQLASTSSDYRLVTGAAPGELSPPRPLRRLLPRDEASAIAMALRQHPLVLAAQNAVDAARDQIGIAKSDFLPSLKLSASVGRKYDLEQTGDRMTQASVMARFSIPLYDGGVTASRTRESRAVFAQRQLEADSARDKVRSGAATAWAQWIAASQQLSSAEARAISARAAVQGVARQYQMGERSISDLLGAQQDLLSGRESLEVARRDSVLASFILVHATGGLAMDSLEGDLQGPPVIQPIDSTSIVRQWRIRSADIPVGVRPAPTGAAEGEHWALRR
jgi:outer membrane protein